MLNKEHNEILQHVTWVLRKHKETLQMITMIGGKNVNTLFCVTSNLWGDNAVKECSVVVVVFFSGVYKCYVCYCVVFSLSAMSEQRKEMGEFTFIHALTGCIPEIIPIKYINPFFTFLHIQSGPVLGKLVEKLALTLPGLGVSFPLGSNRC